MMQWNILSKKPILRRPHATIEAWEFERSDGARHSFDIGIAKDAVIVVAMRSDNSVLLLRQYFIAKQAHVYSMVAGVIEEGETPEAAAKRELLEEAGVGAASLTPLGTLWRNKWETGVFHFFLAKNVQELGAQQLDETEDIEAHFVSVEECVRLVRNGEVLDVPVALAAYRAFDYLHLL